MFKTFPGISFVRASTVPTAQANERDSGRHWWLYRSLAVVDGVLAGNALYMGDWITVACCTAAASVYTLFGFYSHRQTVEKGRPPSPKVQLAESDDAFILTDRPAGVIRVVFEDVVVLVGAEVNDSALRQVLSALRDGNSQHTVARR